MYPLLKNKNFLALTLDSPMLKELTRMDVWDVQMSEKVQF